MYEVDPALNEVEHPAPWWFRLLLWLFPGRCREIPEATDPSRIFLRQFAIWKRQIYLQQFCGGENPNFYHSHGWRHGTMAIGLWGSIGERVPLGYWTTRRWQAPYFRYMNRNFVHQSLMPSPGHTSIFIGFGEHTDLKGYWELGGSGGRMHRVGGLSVHGPTHWTKHVRKVVKRI